MGNEITLAKKYVPLLDKIYKLRSLTSILDGPQRLVREGANAGELLIPKMVLQGLADYSRNGGYVAGDATLTWETVASDYDRGRKFNIDVLDDEETMGVAFGQLAEEFIRTKVGPEIDAYRFAKYAGLAGTKVSAVLSTGAGVVEALRACVSTMDEDEVPAEDRVLFITPTLLGLVEDLDTTKSRQALAAFSKIVKVPQKRFYTVIDLYDGTTSGEEGGGYIKDASTGKNLNFMGVAKSAVMQFPKHVAPKIIKAAVNQTADADSYCYRINCIADVYDNKTKGVYSHYSTS